MAEPVADVAAAVEPPATAEEKCANPDPYFDCYAVPADIGSTESVVVKSSGPSAEQFPAGRKFGSGGTLTLRAGDRITLISQQGARTLTGPGTFRALGDGPNRAARFAVLTRQRSGSRARTGAVRGVLSGVLTPPAAPAMQVVRGAERALAWYSIGRQLSIDARVCLPANAVFITFERLDGGGQITYGGGGCNLEVTPPPVGTGEEAGVWRGP